MATAISVGFFSNFVRLEFLPPHPTSSFRFLHRHRAALPLVLRTSKPSAMAAEAERKRPLRRITKPRPVSPAMQALVGVPEIPRTQALKLIWAYIKQHDLQDPENKKIIVCDEKLKNLFGGREPVGFLEISLRVAKSSFWEMTVFPIMLRFCK